MIPADMSRETSEQERSPDPIGARMRRRRLELKISLQELARKAGVRVVGTITERRRSAAPEGE